MSAGEAQKIDRIMEKFAERYCCDNPGAFAAADGAYLLAFALVTLLSITARHTTFQNSYHDRGVVCGFCALRGKKFFPVGDISIDHQHSVSAWIRQRFTPGQQSGLIRVGWRWCWSRKFIFSGYTCGKCV